jgi:hypothetical protein
MFMGEKHGLPSASPRLQRRFERSRLEAELWEAVYEELLKEPIKDIQQSGKLDSVAAEIPVASEATHMEVCQWRICE